MATRLCQCSEERSRSGPIRRQPDGLSHFSGPPVNKFLQRSESLQSLECCEPAETAHVVHRTCVRNAQDTALESLECVSLRHSLSAVVYRSAWYS